MNYWEKIVEKGIEYLVGLVFVTLGGAALAAWAWLPKVWLTVIDNKIPKVGLWAGLISALMLLLPALAYIFQQRKKTQDAIAEKLKAVEELKTFEGKHLLLQSGHDGFQTENTLLKKQLEELAPKGDLDDSSEEILRSISFANGGVCVEDIVIFLNMNSTLAAYYLEEMRRQGYLGGLRSLNDGLSYHLTQDGRKYLKDKGHLTAPPRSED